MVKHIWCQIAHYPKGLLMLNALSGLPIRGCIPDSTLIVSTGGHNKISQLYDATKTTLAACCSLAGFVCSLHALSLLVSARYSDLVLSRSSSPSHQGSLRRATICS